MFARLRSLVTALIRREQFEETLSEELRFHLDVYAADLIEKGVSRKEAYRQARVHFGSVERVRDECRDALGLRSVDALRQDVRVGLRVLRRTPLVSGVAVVTIALATGLAILRFSIVYGVLLRPLPVDRPHRVMAIEPANAEFEALDLRDFRDRQTSFDQVEGYSRRRVTLVRPGTPAASLQAAIVTAGALDHLGVPPILGRTFVDGEDFTADVRHLVIGEQLWLTRFDGASDILGTQLSIDGRLLEVVGVMPAGFRFPVDEDLWLPMDFDLPTEGDLRTAEQK